MSLSAASAESEPVRIGSAGAEESGEGLAVRKMATVMKRALRGALRWGTVLAQVAAYPLSAGSKVRRRKFRLAAEALKHQLPLVSLSKIINPN